MATAKIQINGTVGSRTDIVLAATVSLSNQNNTGVTTWNWYILSQPAGSPTITLSSSTSSAPNFPASKEGSYLIKLVVNQGLAGESTDQVVAAVRELETGARIPAVGETTEVSATSGWAEPAVDEVLQRVTRLQMEGVIAGVAAEVLAAGDVVYASATTTQGTPSRRVAKFSKANANVDAEIRGALGVVIANVSTGVLPANINDRIQVRMTGLCPTSPVLSGAVGDKVYVSDTGQMSLTAGTTERQIGTLADTGTYVFLSGYSAGGGTLTGPAGGVLTGSYPNPNGLQGVATPLNPPVGYDTFIPITSETGNIALGVKPVATPSGEFGIWGAAATASGAKGGNISLRGGYGIGMAESGDAAVIGHQAVLYGTTLASVQASAGGSVSIYTGAATTTGHISITVGTASGGNAGGITITAGAAGGGTSGSPLTAGAIAITGGAGTGPYANAGSVTITGGAGVGTASAPGNVSLIGGASTLTESGGTATVRGGSSALSGGSGGGVTIAAGGASHATTATGGTTILVGGATAFSSISAGQIRIEGAVRTGASAGRGGSVLLEGGIGHNGIAGNVELVAGSTNTNNAPGAVSIVAGDSVAYATGGSININSGNGATTTGSINLNDTSDGDVVIGKTGLTTKTPNAVFNIRPSLYPYTMTLPTAATQITVTGKGWLILLNNTSGGSLTLTNAAPIELPTAAARYQRLLLVNTSANDVVLSDNGTNLFLGAINRTLHTRGTIELLFVPGIVGYWTEISFASK